MIIILVYYITGSLFLNMFIINYINIYISFSTNNKKYILLKKYLLNIYSVQKIQK